MTRSGRGYFWAILTLVAALAFGASPFLAPGFNGFTAGQFPIPQTDPPVQPAGYAFAIWGPIYLWLVVGAVFGLALRAAEPDWTEMRGPLVLSMAIGAVWLPVAQISVLGATVLIWLMLISALVALVRAPELDHWFARAPVGLYAGWLTAASCVAIGLVLAGYLGVAPRLAAILSIALALAIALPVLLALRDVGEYGVAVAWALAGIAVANYPGDPVMIAIAGVSAVAALILGARAATR
jgi:hypothetical protein